MIAVYDNVPLKLLNTMGIGGNARRLVTWDTVEDLREIFSTCKAGEVVKPIGQGSNLLFVDNHFNGTLLSCNNETVLYHKQGNKVTLSVAAGKSLDALAHETASQGLWGLENLALIPGTVGAAAVQNVGAYGVEFGMRVQKVHCYDRTNDDTVTLSVEDLRYGYRDSIFKHPPCNERHVIISVDIELSTSPAPVLDYGNLAHQVGESPKAIDVYDAICRVRSEKLPDIDVVGSAGSFFKNPVLGNEEYQLFLNHAISAGEDPEKIPTYSVELPGRVQGHKLSAAWLIDHAGWKGVAHGDVGTWPTQPLVIVNLTGKASGDEVAQLAGDICSSIKDKFGVTLTPEVEYLKSDIK